MRLKSLELKGFKSFAHDTVIHFGEDVIGIVGPNGSGKSNIVDAIRWVLGEQKTKELRLEKMQNVIFNGTKKRKPAPMAQVTLTFENTKNILPTEYANVAIARILYQSGESEYRLNNVVCRLKDITNLFLDTGIGSHSYAIIALGMVDDILNDRENSRRYMIEQAAGVSKYKNRKNETLNKLESTTQDLERVEDLLFEIEGNLKQLESQAKRTQRYYQLRDEYKEKSIQLSILRISAHKEKYKQLNTQIEQETDRCNQMEIQYAQLEAEIEQIKKDHLDQEKSLSENQRELNQLVGKIRALENDKRLLAQQRTFVEQNLKKFQDQVLISQNKLTELTEEIAWYRSEMSQEIKLEEKLEAELNEAATSLKTVRESHGTLKTDLDAFLTQQQSLEKQILELEKQKAINQNRIDDNNNEKQHVATDVLVKNKEIEALTLQLAEIQQQEAAKAAQIEQTEKEEASRLHQIEQAEQVLEDLQKKQAEINRQLDAKKNELKLTKSLVENLEGFPESIRFLSNPKNWQRNAPLLSDLVYCKPEYRTCIENYLEPFLNFYVVDTYEEAGQAIQLLGKAQKGKANFFVLEAFHDYSPESLFFNNAIQATELVEVDAKYRNLCNFLLDKVVVADSEDLLLPNDMKDDRVAVLSKTGSWIKRKYSFTGGSVGLFEGKRIGRKKNLEMLEQDIKKLEESSSRIYTEINTHRQRITTLKAAQKTSDIRDLRNQSQLLSQNRIHLQARIENLQMFLRQVDDKNKNASEAIFRLNDENVRLSGELEKIRAFLTTATDQIANVDSSYRQVADQMTRFSEAYNEKQIGFIRQQNKVSTLQRELSFREKQLEDNKNLHQQAGKGISEAQNELLKIDDDTSKMEKELASGYDQRKVKEKELGGFEQTYYQTRNQISTQEETLRKLNRTKQEAQALLQQLKDRFNEIKMELHGIGERLKVEFQISINDLINQEADPSWVMNDLQEKVDRLKTRLDNYGEINPMAVEAYTEMKERYDTIINQRNDILQAKESLLKTIEEIQATATLHFMEAFDAIRAHFIEVFRSLFTDDDSCDMVLMDENDPLESGIQITAKPKGKRPQSINQLSGGEKTLTATAFLFALYLYKPAPFCIFDEVDAPLDDANIDKFNKIIKKFSKDSQFIIVTHNKQTMAAVDVIYGVHMPEQGVSEVTAVDFRSLPGASK